MSITDTKFVSTSMEENLQDNTIGYFIPVTITSGDVEVAGTTTAGSIITFTDNAGVFHTLHSFYDELIQKEVIFMPGTYVDSSDYTPFIIGDDTNPSPSELTSYNEVSNILISGQEWYIDLFQPAEEGNTDSFNYLMLFLSENVNSNIDIDDVIGYVVDDEKFKQTNNISFSDSIFNYGFTEPYLLLQLGSGTYTKDINYKFEYNVIRESNQELVVDSEGEPVAISYISDLKEESIKEFTELFTYNALNDVWNYLNRLTLNGGTSDSSVFSTSSNGGLNIYNNGSIEIGDGNPNSINFDFGYNTYGENELKTIYGDVIISSYYPTNNHIGSFGSEFYISLDGSSNEMFFSISNENSDEPTSITLSAKNNYGSAISAREYLNLNLDFIGNANFQEYGNTVLGNIVNLRAGYYRIDSGGQYGLIFETGVESNDGINPYELADIIVGSIYADDVIVDVLRPENIYTPTITITSSGSYNNSLNSNINGDLEITESSGLSSTVNMGVLKLTTGDFENYNSSVTFKKGIVFSDDYDDDDNNDGDTNEWYIYEEKEYDSGELIGNHLIIESTYGFENTLYIKSKAQFDNYVTFSSYAQFDHTTYFIGQQNYIYNEIVMGVDSFVSNNLILHDNLSLKSFDGTTEYDQYLISDIGDDDGWFDDQDRTVFRLTSTITTPSTTTPGTDSVSGNQDTRIAYDTNYAGNGLHAFYTHYSSNGMSISNKILFLNIVDNNDNGMYFSTGDYDLYSDRAKIYYDIGGTVDTNQYLTFQIQNDYDDGFKFNVRRYESGGTNAEHTVLKIDFNGLTIGPAEVDWEDLDDPSGSKPINFEWTQGFGTNPVQKYTSKLNVNTSGHLIFQDVLEDINLTSTVNSHTYSFTNDITFNDCSITMKNTKHEAGLASTVPNHFTIYPVNNESDTSAYNANLYLYDHERDQYYRISMVATPNPEDEV